MECVLGCTATDIRTARRQEKDKRRRGKEDGEEREGNMIYKAMMVCLEEEFHLS
jgi:hypothetical protein